MSELKRRAEQAQQAPPERQGGLASADPDAGWGETGARPITDVSLPGDEEQPDPGWAQRTEGDPDKVPVHIAWARVMNDVRYVAKDQSASITTSGGSSYSFRYRGIDQILNAAGPAIRRHGVMVMPVDVETTYGQTGKMRDVQVIVTYEIWGPMGERAIRAKSAGEALDTSERGTTKALTNAYRSMLVAALALPTADPKLDPDRTDYQRAEVARPTPGQYVEEVLNTKRPPTLRRLVQIRSELRDTPLAGALVTNETGDDERLMDLVNRVGKKIQDEQAGKTDA